MTQPEATGAREGLWGLAHRPGICLDFDGVICSPRAFIAQEEVWGNAQRELRWADPIACCLVATLCAKYNPWVVVSSTWRASRDRCSKILDRYKISSYLHEDWRTGEDPKRYRGAEVRQWLAEHGNPPFVILDDDTDFDDDQKPWLVVTDSHDGMSLTAFDQADKLLEKLRARAQAPAKDE